MSKNGSIPDKKTGENRIGFLVYFFHQLKNVETEKKGFSKEKKVEIYNVSDEGFRKYGKVLKGYDFTALLRGMRHTPIPEGVVYVPSVEELEAPDIAKELQNKEFGGLPIQIGYCNGHNKKLNAVEYHRNSEINIAVTDLVLLLGCRQDIEEDFTYDTSKIEAFFVPAGTGIEIYGTTLHYAPCNMEQAGFQCIVVLPRGTNTELSFPVKKTGEEKLMTAKNKWLIVHEEAAIPDAFNGLKGENIQLR